MNASFLSELNSKQHEAVTFSEGNLLVLAGAGSGKTRVLTSRIAWFVSKGISANQILAVTFTNKAAKEMGSRLEKILNESTKSLWIGTFHGLAHRLLRLHWQEAKLDPNFSIIDADEQVKVIKKLMSSMNLDPDKWPPKQAQWFINHQKERGTRANQLVVTSAAEKVLQKIYLSYEEACLTSSIVDFSELLLRTYELFRNNPELLMRYQERFKQILVDEFQDTNNIQYDWIRLMCGESSMLTVVGDDDQSIYSWRGANSYNMQRLSADYQNLTVIRLEQNYRSTASILAAANAVIVNNCGRLGKKLWTDSNDKHPIAIYNAYNEIDEANYLVEKIRSWVDGGRSFDEVAILYRSNIQSRVIEEQILRAKIPYKVYGGMRFFERAEVKDILAYLRLALNANDNLAFERVVNLPSRGIGEVSLGRLRSYAAQTNKSLWQSLLDLLADGTLNNKTAGAAGGFVQVINELNCQVDKLAITELIQLVVNLVNLKEFYSKASLQEKQSRLENIDELINAGWQFASSSTETDLKLILQNFLTSVVLELGEQPENEQGRVKLMTLHAAKGLEFPLVFLCGMEEGIFPNARSLREEGLEEERRLCYVGLTRAMERLHLSYAELRRSKGLYVNSCPSRFLNEIPTELITKDWVIGDYRSTDSCLANKVKSKFYLGQNVWHDSFGLGVVTGFEGQGEFALIKINFERFGNKLLSPKYASLKAV